MQIGEEARRTALTVDPIRFYQRRALLPEAGRIGGQFRSYNTLRPNTGSPGELPVHFGIPTRQFAPFGQ